VDYRQVLLAIPRNCSLGPLGWEAVPIDYCLVSPAPKAPDCQVQSSAFVMVTVIFCNVVKFCCIIIALFTEHGPPWATLGNAVASFLESPDPTTNNECLLDMKTALEGKKQGPKCRRWKEFSPLITRGPDQSYQLNPARGGSKPLRWFEVPSKTR
jgi:hypothetical protein